MELSSGASALRTLKHRSKVPQGAVDTSAELLALLEDPLASAPGNAATREKLESGLQTLLFYGSERWEPLAVACVVIRDCMEQHLDSIQGNGNTAKSEIEMPLSETFLLETVRGTIHKALEHYEPRVRTAIAKLLGALARWRLEWVMSEFAPQIVESVQCNLTRSPDFEESGMEEFDDNISMNGMETPPQSPAGTPRTPSTPHRLDDVSGWKALETSYIALKCILKESAAAFLEKDAQGKFVYLDAELADLITTKSCFHVNRHVRVVGLDTISALCDVAPVGFLEANRKISDTLNRCVMRGLEDNWSQVRYAASISARAFLVKLQEPVRSDYLPFLVPRLCLNRYYVAERVQKHTLETWRMIMGDRGRAIVAQYAPEIVDYYVEMTNHCVREAACQCIGELGMKIDADAIRPHVPRLLEALVVSFHDAAWLVRDAACLASAQFALGFPEETRPYLHELYHLWFEHVADQIWSVREDTAMALANVIRAYGQEALDKVTAITRDYLVMAKDQPAMSQQEYDDAIRSARKHMSKQAFPCCALEPKTLEVHTHQENQPWEHTDGAIYLVRELCVVAPEVAVQFMPALADVAILRHFPQTGTLQETLWKQLPAMCEALGKRVFKRYLELFFDPLVFTLQGSHRLAKFAAVDCVAQLSKQIGPSIFLGRLQANPIWTEVLAPIAQAKQQPFM